MSRHKRRRHNKFSATAPAVNSGGDEGDNSSVSNPSVSNENDNEDQNNDS